METAASRIYPGVRMALHLTDGWPRLQIFIKVRMRGRMVDAVMGECVSSGARVKKARGDEGQRMHCRNESSEKKRREKKKKKEAVKG